MKRKRTSYNNVNTHSNHNSYNYNDILISIKQEIYQQLKTELYQQIKTELYQQIKKELREEEEKKKHAIQYSYYS